MIQNMIYFILVLFLIVFLVKSVNEKMTHKLFFYHHSNTKSKNELESNFLTNQLNVKEENIRVAPTEPAIQEEDAFMRCHVPSLNTEECWKSRFFKCPVINGSYAQCTNNYIPLPKSGNAPCETGRAGFEMAPAKYKISENCFNAYMGNRTASF